MLYHRWFPSYGNWSQMFSQVHQGRWRSPRARGPPSRSQERTSAQDIPRQSIPGQSTLHQLGNQVNYIWFLTINIYLHTEKLWSFTFLILVSLIHRLVSGFAIIFSSQYVREVQLASQLSFRSYLYDFFPSIQARFNYWKRFLGVQVPGPVLLPPAPGHRGRTLHVPGVRPQDKAAHVPGAQRQLGGVEHAVRGDALLLRWGRTKMHHHNVQLYCLYDTKEINRHFYIYDSIYVTR